MIKKLLILALTLYPSAAFAVSQTIWSATDRGPATGTMRFPVDTSSSSGPGYLTPAEIATYFASASLSLSNKTILTGSGANNVLKINNNVISFISGNSAVLASSSGSLTSGDCVNIDANFNYVDAGAPCGSGFNINLGAGLTYAPGAANSTPVSSTQPNIYRQTYPNFYTATHDPVTAAELTGLDICNAAGAMNIGLPQAGSAGFLTGSALNFSNQTANLCTLIPHSGSTSTFNGMPLVSSNVVFSHYGFGSCVADANNNWDCSGFAGYGTITSGAVIKFNSAAGDFTAATAGVDYNAAITWPTTGKLMVAGGNSPTGLAEVDGQCALGAGGVWTVGSCNGTAAFTLTTTGTSGAATYTGGVLNVPQYNAGVSLSGTNTWTGVNTFSAALITTPVSLSIVSTAIATNAALGNYFEVTLAVSAATTMSLPTNPVAGQVITYELTQPSSGTGGTVTWNGAFDFGTSGAPTLTTTNSKVDLVGFRYGSNSKWNYIGSQLGF